MREASENANITIITIALIGVVVSFGAILIPRMNNNTSKKTCCLENDGILFNNECYAKESCNTDLTTVPTNCTEILDVKC